MKKLLTCAIVFLLITGFTINELQKILADINTRYKNVEVSIIEWPDELHSKLGDIKKLAFMATPREKTEGRLPFQPLAIWLIFRYQR